MRRGWHRVSMPLGMFILEYLLTSETGDAYIWDIYKAWRESEYFQNWKAGKGPRAFYNYFWYLKKLGLVEETRREEVLGKPFPRIYYRVTPGAEQFQYAWINPKAVLYPKTILGKWRYDKNLSVEELDRLAISMYPQIARERERLEAFLLRRGKPIPWKK